MAGNFICTTCGVQTAASATPPERCLICDDERQYPARHGLEWTTGEELRETHRNRMTEIEPNLFGIGTDPPFAIGQRALLVCTAHGNVLWDCISLLDDQTVGRIADLGGIDTIAISHPHFYASMVDWATVFDARILLHAADREWVMRPDPRIQYWDEDQRDVNPEVRLIHAGGHFPGSTVCHWRSGAGGAGVLLTGDTIHVVADRRWVSFMHSVPNLVPLPASKVDRIVRTVEPLEFDRLYGGWWDYCVPDDARERVRMSAKRYIDALKD